MTDPARSGGKNAHPRVQRTAHGSGRREAAPLGQDRGARTGTAASARPLVRLNEEPAGTSAFDREKV